VVPSWCKVRAWGAGGVQKGPSGRAACAVVLVLWHSVSVEVRLVLGRVARVG
jgi:hypothetical protein